MTEKPYRSAFKKLDDVQASVGDEIGLSEWMLISQEEVNTFGKVTHDEQWIHTDVSRAQKESPYGGTILHGFHILSLARKFSNELYNVESVKMIINYGLDKVRFPAPTPVGAMLRARMVILSFSQKAGAAFIKLKMTFEIQGEKKPACIAEILAICYE